MAATLDEIHRNPVIVAAVSKGEALYIRGMAIVSGSRGNQIG
jgi:hypothetical protein